MPNVAAPEEAGRCDLIYVDDAEPGFRRRRAGRGFFYDDAGGARIRDETTLARIRAIAVPPGWTDVWICPDAAGHIQATGRDDRGRKQYRYHPAWTALRDQAKFSSLAAFARALPRLRRRVDADLRRRGAPGERVMASIVRLLDNSLIRVGNDAYARDNNSFGLTTLRARHVRLEGPSLHFSFTGKSRKKWRLRLEDRRVASVVRAIQDLPGQRLFRYIDEEGHGRDVHSQDVNDYIRDAMGPEFTSKHFRTWGATVSAALALAALEVPETKREQAIALNRVLDEVAGMLRNTRTVCRRCYVHPAIVEAWRDGRLGAETGAILRRRPRPLKGLDLGESTVLRWLSAQEDGDGPPPG